MTAEPRTGPLRKPGWILALGLPSLALLFLIPMLIWPFNQPLFYWFNSLSKVTGPAFWAHVTILGDGLVCAVLFLPWIRRHPERMWGGLLGALVMFLVLHSVKKLTGQHRPLAVLPEETVTVIGPELRTRAFPSGHTATFALYAGILAMTTRRRPVVVAAMGFAILVGVSRMVVGVHWPADVLGGLALGWLSAFLGLRWAARATWTTRPFGRRILGAALIIAGIALALLNHTGYPGTLLFQRGLALVCLAWGGIELFRELRPPGTERAAPTTTA